MKIICFIFLLYSTQVFAYVISKTESGNNIKWTKSNTTLDLFINPTPLGYATSGISKTQAQSIIQESVDEWNLISKYQINPIYTATLPVRGTSKTLSFSSDERYFGSGVVAVTRLSYNATSGDISSADILLNESYVLSNGIKYSRVDFTDSKSSSSGSKFYIGDVVTHELGHFFGLSHSEHTSSSMIFSIFKGQHSIHADDIAGLYDLYEVDKTNAGISGRVIAGNSIPIFGVRVTAISTISGDAVQSQLTDESGEFNFKNLALGDSYYVMVSPYKNLSNISSVSSEGSKYYSTPKYNFCSQNDFKASFYMQCGPRSKSKPQAFYLNGSNPTLDIGDVTVRCDENVDSLYYSKKFEATERAFELNDNTDKTSFLFSGIFSDLEITNGLAGLGDEFSIDLTGINTSGVDASAFKLRLKILTTGIDSAMGLQIVTKRSDEGTYQTFSATTDSTGKTITDFEINLFLSSTTSNNLFSIKVYPIKLSDTEKYEIFSTTTALSNNSSQYILNAQVGYSVGSVFTPLNPIDSYPYEDNSTCTEGEASYTVAAHTSLTSSVNNAQQLPVDEDIAGVSCGTIDIDDDSNSGGMGSFIVGIFLILLLTSIPNLNNQVRELKY
jgi:hypothetical protein